jgi:putative CocE/NonD family hydrolase
MELFMSESSDVELSELARAQVELRWGVRIPLRDGVHLSATLYLPQNHRTPSPAIITLTPYVAQTFHDLGTYFAAYGLPFLAVDVRGRGNSDGDFQPFIQEAEDGYDVVEWVARQPYCSGMVAMWGGSYGGLAQWNTAREFPPHLATIVPVASLYIAVDFPIRNNIADPYWMQWLTFVSGHTLQDKMFWNKELYWGAKFRAWFESGASFRGLDSFLGNPSSIFQHWVSHPHQDDHWDRHNPTAEQYAKLSIPILTITGIYDSDQPGALMHYRQHLKSQGRSIHYLVIGPWDHAGTRTPRTEFVGLKVGAASLIDLPKLHRQWYAWIMQGGDKPEFLRKPVAYYLMGAEKWCYADTLDAVTSRSERLYLQSSANPTDVFKSGSLCVEAQIGGEPDYYVYDPADIGQAPIESIVDPESRVDQRMIHASVGKQLVYHGAPFESEAEISGFFRLRAWISIDQPDTDFRASVYEVLLDGSSVLLTSDTLRARYRESLRSETLITTKEPLRYDFERFTFISRQIKRGSRLRLVFGPINSIYSQKNYNTGGIVSDESMRVARPVTVTLFHDQSYPSALYVPFGQSEG